MSADLFDLSRENDCPLEPGAAFELEINYEADDGTTKDLSTGWTALAQVRHTFDSDVALTFTVTLDNADPNITLSASDTATAALQDSFRKGVWDLMLDDGSDPIRLLQGHVEVNPQVSRA